jgi:hypothetical protein
MGCLEDCIRLWWIAIGISVSGFGSASVGPTNSEGTLEADGGPYRGLRRQRARKPSSLNVTSEGRGRGRPAWPEVSRSPETVVDRLCVLPPTIPCYVPSCWLRPRSMSTRKSQDRSLRVPTRSRFGENAKERPTTGAFPRRLTRSASLLEEVVDGRRVDLDTGSHRGRQRDLADVPTLRRCGLDSLELLDDLDDVVEDRVWFE